jgi:selenocysteine lyase/cysteine desulfurase
LIVDAIQGLGAFEQTLAPADVLVSGGVKWMRAGWGSGVIAASPVALERLEPLLTGWFGVEDFFDFAIPVPHAPRADAERLRIGSPSIYGVVALAAALEVIELAGMSAIEESIADIVVALDEALEAVGAECSTPWRSPAERAGIIRFRMPGADPAQTAQDLAAAGLVVSQRADWIRLSPHATTDLDVVDALAEVLAE